MHMYLKPRIHMQLRTVLNCAHNNCENDQVTLCLKAVERTQPHARYRGKADAVAVLRQPITED